MENTESEPGELDDSGNIIMNVRQANEFPFFSTEIGLLGRLDNLPSLVQATALKDALSLLFFRQPSFYSGYL